jgi:hypothetical protein
MRFQKLFSRAVAAAGTTTLGTDTVPSGKPSAVGLAAGTDNSPYLSTKLKNIDGFPVQRLCVAYHGPTNAKALSGQLWVYDDLQCMWFKSGAAVTMQPEAISWFDQPSLQRLGAGGDGTSQDPGGLDLYLIVSAAGSDPDGTYAFSMGVDISNNGATEMPITATATIDKTGLATSAKQDTANAALSGVSRIGIADAASFQRPNDSNPYVAGDAIANSTTAGSVVPISFAISDTNDAPVAIRSATLVINGTAAGTAGATFTLHLYRSSPTATAGDNAAFTQPAIASGYLGSLTGQTKLFADGSVAIMAVDQGAGQDLLCRPTSGARTIFGLLQLAAGSAGFTPAAQATKTITLSAFQGRA